MEQIQFPNKKYNIIYADPPWKYKDKAHAGKRGAVYKYPVQTHEWISNLPVNDIADNNCVLFLWVTMPMLNSCWDIITKWGFKYKTIGFVWIKNNKKTPTLFWGMGHWTRSNPELCLLSVKGKPKRINAGVHSVVNAPIQQHSQKPNEVRERIVNLMGNIPRIELFAREKIQGWDGGFEFYHQPHNFKPLRNCKKKHAIVL